MALYIKLAATFRQSGLLEKKKNESVNNFKWTPTSFDDYIFAYAKKHNITLYGLDNIDELTQELKADVELPAAGEEAWAWPAAFKVYDKSHPVPHFFGPGRAGKAGIGGDGLDLTAWRSADRKKYAFNNKDPLGKKEIDDIKSGSILLIL